MPKRLIVCFDGTWNTADRGGSPTNVVRLARMIPPKASDGTQQIVFYDAGVGTGNAVDRLVGGAFGRGLESHVKLGFQFLAQNYEPNDEIYLFGFSRGAFTARSLGGFIGACRGLLSRENQHKLADCWKYYRSPPAERNGFELHNEIENHVHHGVRIECLGVWDTVGALGIPGDAFNVSNRARYAFHDTALSALTRHAFQALAIDEQRGPFEATLWERPKEPISGQVVEQVWFPGVHANVGGGYPNSELADLALRWMLARIVANTKLEFDTAELPYFLPEQGTDHYFKKHKTSGDEALGRIRKKWKGELYDSLSWYVTSRISPMMRVIGGQKARMGTGLVSKSIYRTSTRISKTPFLEKIHWSARDRHSRYTAEDVAKYDPPNLRVALDNLDIVEMEQELQPGTPWHL